MLEFLALKQMDAGSNRIFSHKYFKMTQLYSANQACIARAVSLLRAWMPLEGQSSQVRTEISKCWWNRDPRSWPGIHHSPAPSYPDLTLGWGHLGKLQLLHRAPCPPWTGSYSKIDRCSRGPGRELLLTTPSLFQPAGLLGTSESHPSKLSKELQTRVLLARAHQLVTSRCSRTTWLLWGWGQIGDGVSWQIKWTALA